MSDDKIISVRFDGALLEFLEKRKGAGHSYADTIKTGVQLYLKSLRNHQISFMSAEEVARDSRAYEYKLATRMSPEELDDYQRNYKEKGFSIKDYWEEKGKKLL